MYFWEERVVLPQPPPPPPTQIASVAEYKYIEKTCLCTFLSPDIVFLPPPCFSLSLPKRCVSADSRFITQTLAALMVQHQQHFSVTRHCRGRTRRAPTVT